MVLFPRPHHQLVMGRNLCPYCIRTYRILHAYDDVVVDAVLYVGAFVGFTENPFVVRFVFGKQQRHPGLAVEVVVLQVLNQLRVFDVSMDTQQPFPRAV
jgi:glutaredoxin